MKYYHCYWFSQLWDDQHEVDILLGHSDMNQARMIASWYITNISHFDEYPIDAKEFGSVSVMINHEWESINVVSSLFTIKEAFRLLTDIGMEITSVNSLAHPLKENLQKVIRWMLRKEFWLSNDDPFTIVVESDTSDNWEMTPAQLIKVTDLITHILTDSKELYVKAKWTIGWENMTLLTKSIEMLQLTLAQWDILTAKEQTKKLISLMESVEWEYIEYERARDHQVESQLTIPNLNTILAHNQRVAADKLYELHSSEQHKVEQRYQTIYHNILEKWVLYLKWWWSEIAATLKWHNGIVHYFIRKFEYMLIFMSVVVALILESGWHTRYWGNVLFVIALGGFALQLSHLIHTKRGIIKAWFTLLTLSIIWVIWYFIASNLALI
jgi:hypothetical protein